MKSGKLSISHKIIILVVLVLVLSNSIICAFSISRSNVASRRAIRQRMLDIANCAAGSVDGDILEIITAEDEGTPEYQHIMDALSVFRDNVELKYVYGIREEEDGRFTFTVDPTIEDSAEFGSEVQYTYALGRAAKGIPSVDEVPYDDMWGTFYSAYSPVFDSAGEVGGIIGVDFSVDWFNKQLQSQTKSTVRVSLIVLLCTLLFTIPVSYFMVGSITESLKRMTRIAKQYEAGDYSEDIIVLNNDEVGELSQSLQKMADSLVNEINRSNAANQAKNDFFTNMSHELRTPINVLMGMNDSILRDTHEKSTREHANSIKAEGRALLTLVNELLSFSEIEKGNEGLENRAYMTKEILTDLVSFATERSKLKGLELKTNIDPRIPVILYGDDVRLSQVISKLIANAVKYTKEGHISVKAELISKQNKSVTLFINVSDTGLGLKDEELKLIGQGYGRMEGNINHDFEGIGLDMDIVAKLLETMGSRLEIESEYGKGTSASFTIDQGIVNSEAMGPVEVKEELYADTVRRHKFTEFYGARVLAVDDYDMNLKVVKDLLSNFAIVPDLAMSGDEAIDMVRTKVYDLILLDHMMPDPDGIEVLRTLKREKLITDATKVVVLTANVTEGAREMYLANGFNDYISKPIETEELGAILGKYLKPSSEPKIDPAEDIVLEFAPKKKEADPDKWKKDLISAGFDPEEGLKFCAGKKSLYMTMLSEVPGDHDKKRPELRAALDSNDLEKYRINIHALKSFFKTLGSKKLSDMAKDLEAAAKRNDLDYIKDNHDSFIAEYDKTVDFIRSSIK